MNQPLVSICVPTYNRAEYIAEMIDSVQRQTYKNWELIIQDDGSTDSTSKLMEYYKKDGRIGYYKNDKNLGIARTRNNAIRNSNGTFIAVMDSDDIMHPDRIKKEISVIQKGNYDFVYSSYFVADNEARVMNHGWIMPPEKLDKKEIINGYTAPHVTILAKRSCFINTPYNNKYKVNDDLPLVLDWVDKGYSYKRIKKPLMIVRYHHNSISSTRDKEIKKITEEMKVKYGIK